MKQTVDQYTFEQAFRVADRFDQFGYDALKALFDYIEEYEDSCGTEIELDVIAICCEFTQYDSAVEAAKDLITDFDIGACPHCSEELRNAGDKPMSKCPGCGQDFKEELEERALEELRDNTIVIEYDGGVVVQSF